MYDAVVFAGGGNRCYWQGGFWEAAAGRLDLAPTLVVGASAGAFAAIYALLGIGPRVREAVFAACGPHRRNLDLAGWRAGGRLYPVGTLYADLLRGMLGDAELARLQDMTDLHVALARAPRGLPPLAAAALGIGAYQLEKHLFHPVHPRLGRRLGFRAEFVSVRTLRTSEALVSALIASSGVPPFMPVTQVDGRPAFDGGLVDNVPIDPLLPVEAAGGRTLVLLTRRYGRLPQVPGRTYVQPSEPIRVKQFDVRNPGAMREAYVLGLRDGAAFRP